MHAGPSPLPTPPARPAAPTPPPRSPSPTHPHHRQAWVPLHTAEQSKTQIPMASAAPTPGLGRQPSLSSRLWTAISEPMSKIADWLPPPPAHIKALKVRGRGWAWGGGGLGRVGGACPGGLQRARNGGGFPLPSAARRAEKKNSSLRMRGPLGALARPRGGPARHLRPRRCMPDHPPAQPRRAAVPGLPPPGPGRGLPLAAVGAGAPSFFVRHGFG